MSSPNLLPLYLVHHLSRPGCRTKHLKLEKLTLCLLFTLGLLLPLGAQSVEDGPSAEEIATAYVETIGGAEAWKGLSAVQMEGSATMQGMQFPFTMTTAQGDKNRFEMDIQGNKMVQAYDGQTAWMYFPMQGVTEPKEMSDEESADMKDSPFLDVFIDAEARGYQLEKVAGQEIEGTPTYGVRVTNAQGFDRTYYFDTETMVPIMMTFTGKGGQMKGVTLNTYLSDYEEVGDIIVPMFMEQKVNGQTMMAMTFENVMIDPEIADSFFSMDSME